jgi:putative phosphoribosyl transferase
MIEFDDNTTLSFDPNKEYLVRAAAGAVEREGIFFLPEGAHGLVILALGINDLRQRALALATILRQQRLATFVVDLFSSEEQELDRQTAYFRQNTEIMQQRMIAIADWFQEQPSTEALSIGYFGIDVVGAAALIVAAERPDLAAAVVSAGKSGDLARPYLARVEAPALLIAAQQDTEANKNGQEALALLKGNKQLAQVKGVTTLNENQQSQDEVIRLASEWFARRLIRII